MGRPALLDELSARILRALRLRREMTLTELSLAYGISTTTINGIASGKRWLPLEDEASMDRLIDWHETSGASPLKPWISSAGREALGDAVDALRRQQVSTAQTIERLESLLD